MEKKFYVSTPIYYPNAKPHLGTLYSTLLADIFARWKKQQNYQTFFLTGLDEHGQKIAQAAQDQKMDCQQFVDQKEAVFTSVWQLFKLDYNQFIRTSKEFHKAGVRKFYDLLWANGDIYNDNYTGFYCTPCETFVNFTEEVSQPVCPTCGREVAVFQEENYFFRLSKYQDKLLEFYQANPNFITPKERMNEIVSFVKSGLKDLCISRKSVKWGIPLPNDPSQTMYVWLDALTNYISGVGYGTNQEHFEKFWPADLHIIGKDIVKFHAVYWLAFLMAAQIELPRQLLVHGYIMVNNQKMSKSLANSVDPETLAQVYGVEQVRYYLARHIPVNQDGNFSLEELEQCLNSDLANNLGNLVNRLVNLTEKYNHAQLAPSTEQTQFAQFKQSFSATIETGKKYFDDFQLHLAVSEFIKATSLINAFVHEQQPWKVVKSDLALFSQIIHIAGCALSLTCKMLWPVMPEAMDKIIASLGLNRQAIDATTIWQQTLNLSNPGILFARIEANKSESENTPSEPTAEPKNTIAATEMQETITFDELAKVKIAVGQIKSCQNVAKSDKLYRLEVDFGPLGLRQVVSGIAQYYTPAQLVDHKAAFVINLAPRKIMGLESQAMILAAKDGQVFTITMFEKAEITPGTILS